MVAPGLLATWMLPSLAVLSTSTLRARSHVLPLSADGGERLATEHKGTSAKDVPA